MQLLLVSLAVIFCVFYFFFFRSKESSKQHNIELIPFYGPSEISADDLTDPSAPFGYDKQGNKRTHWCTTMEK